jgi:SAM-dependent methyltransferase
MTDGMHVIAASGYGATAESYERSRPGYPAEVVDWALGELGVASGAPAIEVAAGTGKLTRELVARGLEVTAVEPVAAMRTLLERSLPAVRVLEGTAEALPVEDASASFAAVGTAFHWFEPKAATRELTRVLTPGGGLFLVWNLRDLSDPFMARLATIQEGWRAARSSLPFSLDDRSARGVLPGGRFAPAGELTARQGHVLDRAGLLDRMRSISYVGAMPPTERERELDRVRAFLDGEGVDADSAPVELRYVVRAFLFRRR